VRLLRDFGVGLGALVTVAGLILNGIVPEGRAWTLSVTAFGVALLVAGLILDRKRVGAVLRGRTARAASASAGYTLAVLAVVVMLNFMAGRNHKRFDLTENEQFSLSEQTNKVLAGLTRDVAVTSFAPVDPGFQKTRDLLDEYRYRSGHIQVKSIDPDRSPGEVRRYNVTEVGTVVIESGKAETRITTVDEESLTNAIIKVTSDRERVVYFTAGHGEADLDGTDEEGLSGLKGVLEKQNYVVKPLVLGQGVPEDATAMVIAGPRKPFLDAEVGMITQYADRGGRLLLMENPMTDPGLAALLASFGATVRKDVVIDKFSQLFGGDARIPLVPPDGYDTQHPITKNFDLQTVYPLAASIDIREPPPEGVTATALARTSDLAWGETSEAEFTSGRITLNEGVDTRGPLVLAAAFEKKSATPPGSAPEAHASTPGDAPDTAAGAAKPAGRLVLVGDSDFVTNHYFGAGGNGDLVLNAIAWLVERGELISIRPKTAAPNLAILTPGQSSYYFWTIVVIAPLGIAAVGVAIWWRRKRL
jgi:ABC-type uncharacterized transport system involved in gliding motility auxiliary subunit